MNKKVKYWLNRFGMELVELKLNGGMYVLNSKLKPNRGHAKKTLTPIQLSRFLVLVGQLDALIWIFSPSSPILQKKFINEITKQLTIYEEAEILSEKIGENIPRGEA